MCPAADCQGEKCRPIRWECHALHRIGRLNVKLNVINGILQIIFSEIPDRWKPSLNLPGGFALKEF